MLITKRKLLKLLICLFMLYIIYFGIAPHYEGFYSKEITRIRMLETLEEKGLQEMHKILKDSNSLNTKIFTVDSLEKIGHQSSIDYLINEFDYKVRWWVRWWDYEEKYDVEAYHSHVARNLARIIILNSRVDIIYDNINTENEHKRFWMLYTLSFIDDVNWKVIQDIADNDPNNKIKKLGKLILSNRKRNK